MKFLIVIASLAPFVSASSGPAVATEIPSPFQVEGQFFPMDDTDETDHESFGEDNIVPMDNVIVEPVLAEAARLVTVVGTAPEEDSRDQTDQEQEEREDRHKRLLMAGIILPALIGGIVRMIYNNL